ncbi:hypothetical protein VH441_00620 [Psychrobacter sp. HD31]|uniref:hypothetical protein n=1 Tax=Psychrobacter sp. HD31 TaxID=3112003 RepID=UPI003DA42584
MAIIIFILLCLPFSCAFAYTGDLSKTISGQPIREPLAFFVQKNWHGSQPNQYKSTKQFTQQGKTVVSMVINLPPYNGLTLQNTKAIRRICRAVTNSTESKTRYPMNFHSVALTQNLLGGQS